MSDYKKLARFQSYLRKIEGLHLFMILGDYIFLCDIETIFNAIAIRESEDDLRQMEKMWNEFIASDVLP